MDALLSVSPNPADITATEALDQALRAAYPSYTGLTVELGQTVASFDGDVPEDLAATVTAAQPPAAANAVLGALASLDPDTASVADVVNAVKTALAAAGATQTPA
jgi:hypothetical protein